MNKFLCRITLCALAAFTAGALAAADSQDAVGSFGQIKVKNQSTSPGGQISAKRAKLSTDGLGGKSESNLPGGQIKVEKGGAESVKSLDGDVEPKTAEEADAKQRRIGDLEERKQAAKEAATMGDPKAGGVTPDTSTSAGQSERLKRKLDGQSDAGQAYDTKGAANSEGLKKKLDGQSDAGQAYDTKGAANSEALRAKLKALK